MNLGGNRLTVGELGERELIRQLRAILDCSHPDVPVGNGDDAAVWRPRGDVAVTVDSVVEGVDWLPGQTPMDAVGHRAAAVSLSDLAAMGAVPGVLVLALELPVATPVEDVLLAATGLRALADRVGAVVVGGDVGFSPGPQRWSVTALGALTGPAMRRDLARPGDAVWLVGPVGLAALGLALLQGGHLPIAPLVEAHWRPEPLVRQGEALRNLGVRACLDVSDGLGLDAQRMAEASGVDLLLDLAEPRWLTRKIADQLADWGLDWRVACARGGDDYALLCTAPTHVDVSETVSEALRIGTVSAGSGRVVLRVGGVNQAIGGWQH